MNRKEFRKYKKLISWLKRIKKECSNYGMNCNNCPLLVNDLNKSDKSCIFDVQIPERWNLLSTPQEIDGCIKILED